MFTGLRTDTKPKRIVKTRNGIVYIERMDRSLYPKLTSIPCTEQIRRMLAVFKQAGGYPNYDELLFDLLMSRTEAHSLPKLIVSRAKAVIRLREKARDNATLKGRYNPREASERYWSNTQEDAIELTENLEKKGLRFRGKRQSIPPHEL